MGSQPRPERCPSTKPGLPHAIQPKRILHAQGDTCGSIQAACAPVASPEAFTFSSRSFTPVILTDTSCKMFFSCMGCEVQRTFPSPITLNVSDDAAAGVESLIPTF